MEPNCHQDLVMMVIEVPKPQRTMGADRDPPVEQRVKLLTESNTDDQASDPDVLEMQYIVPQEVKACLIICFCALADTESVSPWANGASSVMTPVTHAARGEFWTALVRVNKYASVC